MGSDVTTAAWSAELEEERARLEAEAADPLDVAAGDPEELREEAGDPTGDVQAQIDATRPAEPEVYVEELRVDGTTQLALDMGGKQPTEAFLTLSVPKIKVASGRAFKKGDRLHLQAVLVVREVAQKDVVDKESGLVVDCQQTHKAQAVDVVVSEA